MRLRNAVFAFFILTLFSCATQQVREPFERQGMASWYGHKFHKHKTANGERYNMYAMTAAHRTLPFGTKLRVKCVETGKEVIVRINDRGPFVDGRILDLSYAAAKELGMIKIGAAKVEIEPAG